MPVLDESLILRRADASLHMLVKRKNWAAKNAGVVLVLCIIGILATGLLLLFLYRKMLARRAARGA